MGNDMTRRNVFAAGTTLALAGSAGSASGLLGAGSAIAQTAATAQAPGFYRYKIGDVTLTAINDGFFRRPLEGFIRNAEMADVKKAMEGAFLSSEQVTISFTTLVVQNAGKLTLIDTGNGDSGAPTSGIWMRNFRAAGFDPKDVTTVIISHFHGDHINGLRLKDGTAVFPNAEIMVPAPEWAFWMDDARMGAAPEAMKGAFANVRRVFAPVAKDVKMFEGGKEIAPGITAVAAHGHTPGHMAFVLNSGMSSLMVMSDTTNHPALFVRNPDWSAIFDQDPDMARASRHRMLDMAVAEKVQTAFYHAPFPATGYITKAGKGFELVPVSWSSAI